MGVFFIIAYRIDLWWPYLGEQTDKFLQDQLICKNTYWHTPTELALENCHNKKQNIKAKIIHFNLLSGRLLAKHVFFKIASASSGTQNKLPNIPSQIKQIEIHDLNLVLPEPLRDIVPPKIKKLKLKRKPFSLKQAWQAEIHSSENLQLNGLLGEVIDLETKFKNYIVKVQNYKAKLNGSVHLKTNNLFKEPLEVRFKKLQIIDQKFKVPAKINGSFILDSDFKKVLALKAPFSLNLGNLKFSNVLLEPLQFRLEKTSVQNLKPFVKNLPLSFGFIEGDFWLNLENNKQTLANLKFDFLALSGQYPIKGLNGNLKFLPLVLAQKINQSNFKQKTLKQILAFLEVKEFNLQIPNNQVRSSNGGFSGFGNLAGKINYAEKQDLKGEIVLNNLSLSVPKQQLGIKNGNAIIKILNEKANLNLKTYNLQKLSEPILLHGELNLWPNQTANFILDIPHFSFFQNNVSPQITSINGHLQNIQIQAVFNQKPIISSAKGQIQYINLKTNQQNIHLTEGKLVLAKNNLLQIRDLLFKTPSGWAKTYIDFPILQKNPQPIIKTKLKMPLNDIQNLLEPYLKITDYKFNGLAEGELELKGKTLNKLNLNLQALEIWQKEKQLISSLNGQVHLNKNQEIALKNFEGYFNKINKFQITGHFSKNNYLPIFDIHILVNPKNVTEFLQEKPGIAFDEGIYLPMSINVKALSPQELDLHFSSSFHKMQLFEKKIVFVPDLNQLENLIGDGNLNWKTKNFKINNLAYSGKDFGILLKAFGQPDKFDFSLESAPLLDLGEIAKIWSEDSAAGQFRGKIIAKDFEPKDQSTWIQNLSAELYSEEDVHDFEYGILFGKYFNFNLKTENGNGNVKLLTRKGKIKNLQITNLSSQLQIKNGNQAVLTECSLETADGKAEVNGNINLSSGEAELTGNMNDVNIETVSNNLFGNLGNYNGKANLNYYLQGNFIDLLKSAPPTAANGDFELKKGSMKQISELSKGLNLANLVFGLPIYFSFSTISHILQPEQDADFLSIKGKWRFSDKQKKIFLEDAVFKGINALHLSLNGDWDFVDKDMNFDVYGFIPKRPMKQDNQSSLLEVANKSRHFKFKVNGNIKNPDSLTNSVKKSIQFLWFPSSNEVRARFKK